jgi:predicted DNA-binding transcriptional regulator AlpA
VSPKTTSIVAEASTATSAAVDPAKSPARLLDKAEVLSRVPLTFPTIWKMMHADPPTFPLSRSSGSSKTVWLEDEVEQWIRNRPVKLARDNEKIEANTN